MTSEPDEQRLAWFPGPEHSRPFADRSSPVWLDEYLSDQAIWCHGALCVEPHNLDSLIDGIASDGSVVT